MSSEFIPRFAMKLITLLVLIPLVKSLYLNRKIQSYQNTVFTDWKILETVLDVLTTRSITECTIFCAEMAECVSCAFNDNTGICMMWKTDFSNFVNTAVEYEIGWKYYDIIKGCSMRPSGCLSNAGYVFDPVACICFKYNSTRMNHDEAINECLTTNGKLARIDRVLKQIKMEQYLDSVPDGEVWIDGTLDNTTNTYRFENGQEMTYFNWNSGAGQPEQRQNEIYIIIRRSSGYLWHDIFPNFMFATICEIN